MTLDFQNARGNRKKLENNSDWAQAAFAGIRNMSSGSKDDARTVYSSGMNLVATLLLPLALLQEAPSPEFVKGWVSVYLDPKAQDRPAAIKFFEEHPAESLRALND